MRWKLSQKPRPYQEEAVEYALKKRRCICILPTGTGKTLIGALWALRLLESGAATRVLVLEPTRYLVEQVAAYYRKLGIKDVAPVHGGMQPRERSAGWRARIVVATPEVVLADIEEARPESFDAVVVDECHHTTGKDAYARLMELIRAEYRLGLTAYLPPSRISEVKRFLGVLRRWGLDDPSIKKYVPEWIGEVYEAELDDAEKSILAYLEEKARSVDRRYRSIIRLAERFFVRDGALALKETLEKGGRMYKVLDGLLLDLLSRVRPAHKMPALERVLADHEGFEKAIIFVDRVTLAYYISRRLEELGYRNIVLCGKSRRQAKIGEIVSKARSPEVKVIVATSAGEEGVDLPTADLLVIWSNVASPLRFIQRHGRLLRKHGSRVKFVAYIVTPGTLDMDSLLDALYMARRAGVDVPLDEETVKQLLKRSVKARVLELVSDRPAPLEWIAELLGMSYSEARRHLRYLLHNGEVVYFYTHLGRVYLARGAIHEFLEEYSEWLEPRVEGSVADLYIGVGGRRRRLHGSHRELARALAKAAEKGFMWARFAVQVLNPDTGSYHLVNLVYSYPVDDPQLARLIVRNAFRYAEYIALGQ